MKPATARLAVSILLLAAVAGCTDTSPETRAPGAPASATDAPLEPSIQATSAPSREAHTLVLSMTGTARLENVSYEVNGEAVEEKAAKLPWEKTFRIESGSWKLVVRHGSGDVRAVATVDGKLFTQGAGGGDGTGQLQLSGSID
ncbi:hypothetical protein [Micromonospora sp. NBC_01796]|uniref:hypothetical protein n=1 Tax=Micromonospora sp. NBC_01796 TaxID=2975987 RepID=UPI002DDA2431|nr:hypothetical protein [Micromonospora sp. NBC_01796]WSA87414.1 hypothetical protein OIE47_07325 [Micromonospora sp. NBC_01796]